MKHEKFYEKYFGKDKIQGRPGRLNRVELKANSKGYAPLLFFGDLHYGSPSCAIKEAKEMLNWALKEKCYILIMGDMIEMNLKGTRHKGVYNQLSPEDQKDGIIELLTPLAKAGLIIGYHEGNHSERISNAVGLDISKIIANEIGVKYCNYSGWHLLKVGKQNYKLYATHGASGSIQPHTKLNAGIKLSYFIDADIVAYAHTHGLATDLRMIQTIDLRNKQIVDKKQYVVMTGAYLYWNGSYAERKSYPISRIGSPKMKLREDSHDIHISL